MAGIRVSVIGILGIGGAELSAEHAEATGRVVSAMDPPYLSLLTLMLVPGTPLHQQWREGHFELLEPEAMLAELRQILLHTDGLSRCLFRTNHASNYVPLAGTLSRDKRDLLATLDAAIAPGQSGLAARVLARIVNSVLAEVVANEFRGGRGEFALLRSTTSCISTRPAKSRFMTCRSPPSWDRRDLVFDLSFPSARSTRR